MTSHAERSHDIVLFGATGFAGELTATYLAEHAPPDCRWALAGRNRDKLEDVRARLAEIDPELKALPILIADAADSEAVRAVAESTRVVISTVGPYVLYGEPLVAACAEAGTDYIDLTGEPEFVNTTYVRHHDRAVRTGARLVHSCGFDSIPHDLGAYFTVQQLPENTPLQVSGYVRVSGAPSGGTFHSVLTALSRGRQNISAARARRRAEPKSTDRAVHTPSGRPHRNPVGDGWAMPFPTLDPQVIARSARALPRYGPDFTYSHYVLVSNLAIGVGGVLGLAGLGVLAQIPPARKALQNRLKPGDGPSPEKRARSWFTVTFVGRSADRKIVTRVSGGDPGYDETAKMLAESALALAFDQLPSTSGQTTPVAAMGDALMERLTRAGIRFEVIAG